MHGVLLDLDGTLLDSNDAHAHAWAEAIEGSGSSLPFQMVRERIGKGGDKLLWELLGIQEQSPEGKHLSHLKKRIFHARYLSQLVAFPGSRELLVRMRQEGLRLVLATSSGKDELENLLNAASLGDLIEHRVTKDDVAGHSKPDPDIVEVAVRQSRLSPAELVMLGDTPFDIESARKVQVKTIAVRCGGWSDTSLAGAAAIYDGPADLLLHYDESPLGRACHPTRPRDPLGA
jgi:HAD superfamily hydrolase (TIGR01509 family)